MIISLDIFTRENSPQFIHICMQSPNQSYGDYKGHIETYVNYNINIIVFAVTCDKVTMYRYYEMLNLTIYARDSCHLHYLLGSKPILYAFLTTDIQLQNSHHPY